MKTENVYIDKIQSLERNRLHIRTGMGGYGVGWKIQREYYRELSPDQKQQYEDAVLILCHSDEIDKAKLGLGLCSELADEFPAGWPERATRLAEELVENGLQPLYTKTTSYSVLNLIIRFRISSLIPFTENFREQITAHLKQGILRRGDWIQLYWQVSRILIKVAPDHFWVEADAFRRDHELLSLLDGDTKSVISIWTSFGAFLYGLDWLSQMSTEFSKWQDRSLRAQVLLSIEQHAGIVYSGSRNSVKRETVEKFLESARQQLGNPG
jgi:hypothetical protein